jgi:tRNA-2-methylthio-N6-dimethylallyladenosine synthase
MEADGMSEIGGKNGGVNVYIETYGCQMNEYDSELVASILADGGSTIARSQTEADVILLNTCAVRENAHRRIYGRLGQLKKLKTRDGRRVTIGILGCMPQNLRGELLENHEEVDFIAGPDSYRRLPAIIEAARAGQGGIEALKLSTKETYADLIPKRRDGVNAWVAVMRGCDNMCTFCVVPFTRGRERSRDPAGVLEEIRGLARDGFRQVTLLGQNVNSYRYGSHSFADLVRAAVEVPGILRVRFTAPHPKDFPEDLIEVITGSAKVCSHIHLPLQAGGNRILQLMNRTYTIEEFERLVERLRRAVPGLALTTDVIVGFPTETRAEFEETFRAMERIRFDAAFIFKYSERKGTYAARHFRDDVPAAEKTSRIVELVEQQKSITGEINRAMVGRMEEVLVEDSWPKDESRVVGRTDGFKNTVIPRGDLKPGDLVRVRIDRSRGGTLYGTVVAAGRRES